MSTFCPQHFRQHFPLLQQRENLQLVYLDNGATTQKPQPVIDAIAYFYCHQNANAHRSSHRLARAATEAIETSRKKAAEFLHSSDKNTVIFTRGATEALNLLASSLCQTLKPGDEILLSELEHHANLVPWQMMAEQKQLVLKFVPYCAKLGGLDLKQLDHLISAKTKILSISGASNTLGCITDLTRIKSRLDDDIIFIVDAAQLAAHRAIDIKKIGCDFLVCSAHKFYGPNGVGLLYGKAERLALLPPWQGGGEMISQVSLESSQYAPAPHKFEPGTSALADIAALTATFDFLQQQPHEQLQAHEKELCDYLHQQLANLPELVLHSRADNNLGIASFSCAGKELELAYFLDQHDIAIRAGHHCTQPLLAKLGCDNLLRASIAAYNSKTDIKRLVQAIRQWLQSGEATPAVTQQQEPFNVDQLLALNGWQARYKGILRWGGRIGSDPAIRNDEQLISGCESQLWLAWEKNQQRYNFRFDSDSRLIRGLAALCISLVEDKSRQEILALDFKSIFKQLGLDQHLSPSRNNGIYGLVQKIQSIVNE